MPTFTLFGQAPPAHSGGLPRDRFPPFEPAPVPRGVFERQPPPGAPPRPRPPEPPTGARARLLEGTRNDPRSPFTSGGVLTAAFIGAGVYAVSRATGGGALAGQTSPPDANVGVDPELARLRAFVAERERDRAKFNAPFNFLGTLPDFLQAKLAAFLPAGAFEAGVATGTAGKKAATVLLKEILFGGNLSSGEEEAIRRLLTAEGDEAFARRAAFFRLAVLAADLSGPAARGGPTVDVPPMWTTDP